MGSLRENGQWKSTSCFCSRASSEVLGEEAGSDTQDGCVCVRVLTQVPPGDSPGFNSPWLLILNHPERMAPAWPFCTHVLQV